MNRAVLFLVGLCAAACGAPPRPSLHDTLPMVVHIPPGIERVEYYDMSHDDDSGPYAVYCFRDGRPFNPFHEIRIHDPLSKLTALAGTPFNENPGGTNAHEYRYAKGAITVTFDGDAIICIEHNH